MKRSNQIRICPNIIIGYIYTYYKMYISHKQNKFLTLYEKNKIAHLLNDFTKFNLSMLYWSDTSVFKRQQIMYSQLVNRCKNIERRLVKRDVMQYHIYDETKINKFITENFTGNIKY